MLPIICRAPPCSTYTPSGNILPVVCLSEKPRKTYTHQYVPISAYKAIILRGALSIAEVSYKFGQSYLVNRQLPYLSNIFLSRGCNGGYKIYFTWSPTSVLRERVNDYSVHWRLEHVSLLIENVSVEQVRQTFAM